MSYGTIGAARALYETELMLKGANWRAEVLADLAEDFADALRAKGIKRVNPRYVQMAQSPGYMDSRDRRLYFTVKLTPKPQMPLGHGLYPDVCEFVQDVNALLRG